MSENIKIPTAENTYCNPLNIPNLNFGDDNRMIKMPAMYNEIDRTLGPEPTHRSISDPTVFYHEGVWYLYPSYGGVWYTTDFKKWNHHKMDPYFTKYSPCITKWGDKFLFTSWNNPLYVGDSPLGPFKLLGKFKNINGTEFVPCDPAIFTDDDGRIYLYAYGQEKCEGAGIHIAKTIGYELDRDDPTQVVRGPVELYRMHPETNVWERRGFHNQDPRFGWVEGVHHIKVGKRHYSIYSSPGTNYGSYVMAVYYSDEGPLDGFKLQKRNPLTEHRYGICAGAGHGCVEKGPNDTLWAFYTMAANPTFVFERRIGMDLVAIDENGEMYCPHGVTDTPQYAPGYAENPIECNSPGYLPLTYFLRPTATSAKPGREPLYASDNSALTWWEPEETDETPVITSSIQVPFYVGAVRLFWQEIGLNEAEGRLPAPIGYILEGHLNGQWFTLIDNKDGDIDYNIDYRTFEPVSCDKVRLTITKKPKGLNIGLRDFTVFGVRDMEK